MENNSETLGPRLARLRIAKGLTQTQLGKLAGAGQSTIATLEKDGRTKTPGSIVEIAHVLGVDAYYLKHGVRSLVAGDKIIDQVVELMSHTEKHGRTVVLDKAVEMQKMYPIQESDKANWRK